MKYNQKKVAGVIFLNKNKELLLQLRDNKKSIVYPNHWSLLGGQIEKRESRLEALKREIKEEINYKIKNPIFLGSFEDEYDTLVYVYKANINKKAKDLFLTEGQKIKYFPFQKAIKLKMAKPLRDFIINCKIKLS
ncbi:MAG: NUDIX domain-containing protein [Candidatus Nanoarchaeia archaeon]